MENEELIQKYIQETLTDAERQQFDTLLKNDPDFAKAVSEQTNLHVAITAHEKEILKSHLQSLEAAQQDIEALERPSQNYKRLAIAIVLIFFFGLLGNYIIRQATTNETLYTTYFEPYPNALAPIIRGEEALTATDVALRSYESKEYEKAIAQLDTILEGQDKPSVDLLFYKAMSLLNLGKEKEALIILRTIKHSETKFAPQIYWYGALIHIKFKENEKALKALQYLDKIQTTYKSKEREVLKAKLE